MCTRTEIEQELDKICPIPEEYENPDEFDQALEKRVKMMQRITRQQVEALLDGELTIDQVVAQQYSEKDPEVDSIHQKVLGQAMEKLKRGDDREDIIDKTVYYLELL